MYNPRMLAQENQAIERAQAAYLARWAPGYRTRRVQWSGGETQAIEIGQGPPLLLIHGGGGYAAEWGPILSVLSERHRVLAVDRPGHGLADPFDYRDVDLLAHCHRFICDFLDAERLPSSSIAANSMGGLFALAFALKSPERIRHLLLVGAPAAFKIALPLPARFVFSPVMKPLIRTLMKHSTPERARRAWGQLLVAFPDRLDDDFLNLEAANQRRNASSWVSLIYRTFDSHGIKEEFVLGERWKQLSVRTTFIFGERDAIARPEVAEGVASENPYIAVVRIPDAGHVPWFDSPGRVAAAINTTLEEVASPSLPTR
jgi:pimeloyl-ACP methyl ester carboxylesterase